MTSYTGNLSTISVSRGHTQWVYCNKVSKYCSNQQCRACNEQFSILSSVYRNRFVQFTENDMTMTVTQLNLDLKMKANFQIVKEKLWSGKFLLLCVGKTILLCALFRHYMVKIIQIQNHDSRTYGTQCLMSKQPVPNLF